MADPPETERTDNPRKKTGGKTGAALALVGILLAVVAVAFFVAKGPSNANDGDSNTTTADASDSKHPTDPTDVPASTNQPTTKRSATPTARIPSTGNLLQQTQQLERLLDPTATGWQTEAFNEAAGKQLKRLSKCIENPNKLDESELRSLITDDFQCWTFKPATQSNNDQLGIQIQRRRIGQPLPLFHKGVVGLQQAVRSLPEPIESAEEFHVKFKITAVTMEASTVQTPVYVEGGGATEDGRVQWKATWNCTWQFDEASTFAAPTAQTAPRLTEIVVSDYEQVTSPDRKTPWFTDDTQSVLGAETSYQQQLAPSTDYWVARTEGRLGISRLGHHGLTIGDVNGDGRDDLYVCQAGGLPNRLYVRRADGTAQDIAAAAGVDYLDDSTCALLVDLDNDGDQDLIVVTVSGAVILSNDGQAKFEPQAILPECSNAFSLTSADYDRDRLPDLYIGRYWPSGNTRGEIAIPVPYYNAMNGGSNMLLRNAGEWKFEDVTEQVGLNTDNTRFTMAAAWQDIDNDGDDDLYVANDFGRNCLYENKDGKFTNIAAKANVEDIASGMSVSFADYNHDGRSDIYVSNMFSSAGNRITYQRKYGERFQATALTNLQRMARGNSLFQNAGDGTFNDVSIASAATMGRWAWGSLFTDINNDGWEDLVVANGFISTDDTGDL